MYMKPSVAILGTSGIILLGLAVIVGLASFITSIGFLPPAIEGATLGAAGVIAAAGLCLLVAAAIRANNKQ